MLSIVTGTLLSGLALLLVALVQYRNTSGLQKIPPAHFTAPYSRLWLLGVRWRSIENRTRLELHRRLGPVVRIGPREVSVDCVEEGTRLIYSSKFAKDQWFHRAFFGDEISFMFITIGNEEHKKRKKMLSTVYSNSYIRNSATLENAISKVLSRFNEDMTGWASTGAPIEVMGRTKACMMDISTAWLYGAENGTNTLRDQVSRQNFSALSAESFEGQFWRCEVHWLSSALRTLGIDTMTRGARLARNELKQWSREMATKASSTCGNASSPTATVYDHLHDSLKRASPEISPDDANDLMAAELNDHLVASYEGGGIAITYAMYELSRRPEQQRALRKELRTLAEWSDQPLTQRIEDLPLLDAVLKETLRVHPPGPGPWPRVVPEPGCRLAGRFDIPAGTIVSSTGWTLQRNPTLFPSPDEWRPERWLEADETTKYEMKKWFWAFGSGARMCIGVHYAIRVLKATLVAVYTDFETLLDDDFAGNMEQVDAPLAGPISNSLNLKFRRHP